MEERFPANFGLLHSGEEFIRGKSVEAIEASENFLAHARLIERAMDLIDYFVRQHKAADDDALTIQLLGIRLFNGAASAVNLLLAGYYQTSALQQRDMLETAFLLDFFQSDRTLIAKWRGSSSGERRKSFAPVVVRNALDTRDGFTERKRDKAYKLLCELAGHPTYAGFRMLSPQPGGDAHCGPFFEATAFKATYEELTKIVFQGSSTFTRFFKARTKGEYVTKIAFMEAQGRWAEKFYGHAFDQAAIDELRTLAASAED